MKNIFNFLKLTLLLLVVAMPTNLFAQGSDKLGAWYVYNGFFNFSTKTELFVEGQWRTWEPVSNTQSIFFRPYFSYNINPNFQIGLGQEYHLGYSYVEDGTDQVKTEEYRSTLQAILKHKIGRVNFSIVIATSFAL